MPHLVVCGESSIVSEPIVRLPVRAQMLLPTRRSGAIMNGQ
jgi:hypothetical protein